MYVVPVRAAALDVEASVRINDPPQRGAVLLSQAGVECRLLHATSLAASACTCRDGTVRESVIKRSIHDLSRYSTAPRRNVTASSRARLGKETAEL